MKRYFITGIGTGIGKTIVSAIFTEALKADYWKPVQAGNLDFTDTDFVKSLISNDISKFYSETYKFKTPVSPHYAAEIDNITINPERFQIPETTNHLIIEGAGGLMVPLNENFLMIDLIKEMNTEVILVSQHYLGSINHSLLTANYCRYLGLDVAGWIFNDDYLSYEEEIVQWSGYPSIGSIPAMKELTKTSIHEQAEKIKESLQIHLIR